MTLVFTSHADRTISGYHDGRHRNATVNLTAPTTGPTDGFVIMGDSTMPLGTTFTTAANATVRYDWNDLPAEW